MEDKYICKFCNVEIEWEGCDEHNGNMWSCEECGEMVCSKCIEDAGGECGCEASAIVCPSCITK